MKQQKSAVRAERIKREVIPPPIDWEEVERLMLRSFVGTGLSIEEMATLERAYRRERKLYRAASQRVRAVEIARLRMQG